MSLSVRAELDLPEFRLDVDFEAGEGLTALFGPSGAGKTLTLRCIAGLSTPDRGRIVASDHLLFDSAGGVDVPPRERGVGYLFQQYALFPHLSVDGNVSYGLHGLDRDARRERVEELLELVGLSGYGARAPGELSGGQQQRVALARALAPEPDVLLLDEPFAAVDLRVRRRLRAELRRIQAATATPMVLVTHDLGEVRELSDSLVVLDRGSAVGAGATDDVLREPGAILEELVEEALG